MLKAIRHFFYVILYGLVFVGLKILFRFEITGRENLPDRPFLVTSNHYTLADPIFITSALRPKDLPRFMAKSEVFKFKPLGLFLTMCGAYPISRGGSDLSAIKKTLEILKAGRNVMIFPEGTRVKTEDASAAKTGAALIAAKAGVLVLPVYISPGRKLFISKVFLHFGEPYYVTNTEKKPTSEFYREAAEDMMSRIYKLMNNPLKRELRKQKK